MRLIILHILNPLIPQHAHEATTGVPPYLQFRFPQFQLPTVHCGLKKKYEMENSRTK